ncbi:hypothetical protein PIB30_035800 [Stylosanthes scabra]|uniref:Uncharacterized protein n=1 Tax=Stylosanthes scabra TaxID=79078 RepID=A0ABU6WGN3_9FABA|nr:hypothetical protein [Stylosanthes scabra]
MGKSKSRELGSWMKADQTGIRISYDKTTRDHNREPTHNTNTTTHKCFADLLLEKLADLSVVELPSSASGKNPGQSSALEPQRTSTKMDFEDTNKKREILQPARSIQEHEAPQQTREKTEQAHKKRRNNIIKPQQPQEKEGTDSRKEVETCEEINQNTQVIKGLPETVKKAKITEAKTWRKQAREAVATTKKRKEIQKPPDQKRKNEDLEAMLTDDEPKYKQLKEGHNNTISAEAAVQPCREQ